MTRTRLLLRHRLFRSPHCGADAFAATAAAGEADGVAAFASADEATKPMEAKESVRPSSFFISFPFPKKNQAGRNPRRVLDA